MNVAGITLWVAFVLLTPHLQASFDKSLLVSDKEFKSVYISDKDGKDAINTARFSSTSEELAQEVAEMIANAISNVMKNPAVCDQALADEFVKELRSSGFKATMPAIERILIITRYHNKMDDLLYELLLRNLRMKASLEAKLRSPEAPMKPVFFGKSTIAKTREIFAPVGKSWPDKIKACPMEAFGKLLGLTKEKWDRDKYSSIERKLDQASRIAYYKGMIDYKNLARIETMIEADAGKAPFLLSSYLDNLKFAKNKLTESLTYIRGEGDTSMEENDETELAVEFTTDLVERRGKVTQRKVLYSKYNSTQIMLIADVMVKASKRMNAWRAQIEIFYRDSDLPDETYLISPMEQYRMALKMLQKDMENLALMDTFKGKQPDYDDVIMAAFETGVFTFKELDYVIAYEEFWNPETSKAKKALRFAFDIAGTMSFYLPPPWNVIGAIGLVFTESKILKHKREANSDNNSNSIF